MILPGWSGGVLPRPRHHYRPAPMSRIEIRDIRPDRDAARPLVAAASLALLLSVLAIVLFTLLRSPLKDDIAWLLYVAHRWLAGRELYVDVVEVNPPLIIWLSAVPIRLADALGVNPQFTAMPFFIGIVLACAWWTAAILRRSGGLFADPMPVFAAIGTLLLVVPAGDLGQREHLLVAAVLPYLALFARSLDGQRPGRTAAIAAGVLAGLGCALKPRYGAVFAVLECLALARGLRTCRLKPLSAIAAIGGYGVLVAVLCPAYLGRAVPMALALYGATDVPFLHLVADSGRLLFGEAVAAALLIWAWRRAMPERNLLLTLVLFSATSTAICFIDGKDWFYHRLPATVTTLLALVLWAGSALFHRTAPRSRAVAPLVLAAIASLVFLVGAFQRLEPEVAEAVEPQDSTVAHLERLIRAEHARTYIAFSEWIALGFPVVNNTGVVWASRFDSMWALKGELWRVRFDPAAAKEWPIRRWVVHDFMTGCPDLAVVDTRGGANWIGVLSTDPVFVRAWSQYRKIDSFDGLDVYRHTVAGCINPWVAGSVVGEPRG
jgi:hypothetical protein